MGKKREFSFLSRNATPLMYTLLLALPKGILTLVNC